VILEVSLGGGNVEAGISDTASRFKGLEFSIRRADHLKAAFQITRPLVLIAT